MNLKVVLPETIQSVSQRTLAYRWDEAAAGRPFPALGDLNPDPATHDSKQLVLWNVEGEGRQRKFRALYQGQNVEEAFSSAWAGKTMEEVVPMSLRSLTLNTAKECAQSGCLVYMIFSTTDSSGQRVECQRLLLPFGKDGSKVEQILASLQLTIAPARKTIVRHFKLQTDVLFSGKIKSGFSGGPVASAGVRPETRRPARRDIRRAARISFPRQNVTCMVLNISATGALIEATGRVAIPDTFGLVIEMETAEHRCTTVWRNKNRLGVRFG
jgi:PilZ domain